MKTEIYLKELSTIELKNIEGGKNLLEYIAQGIGYIVGATAKEIRVT